MSNTAQALDYNIQSALNAILLFDVLKKPILLSDLETLCHLQQTASLRFSLQELEEKEILQNSKQGYFLYGRESDLEGPADISTFFEFIVSQCPWIEGSVRLPLRHSGVDTYIVRNKIRKLKWVTNLQSYFTKKLFSWAGKKLLLFQKNNRIYQEEILSAYLLTCCHVVRNEGFKKALLAENPWIKKELARFVNEPLSFQLSDTTHIKKVRKSDTAFCAFLEKIKNDLNFYETLALRKIFARQWLVSKIGLKSISNRIV